MLLEKYKLDEKGEPVLCEDLHEWARSFEYQDRQVGNTLYCGLRISTVFLGMNHRFTYSDGPPILWETMIFSRSRKHELENYQRRCSGAREQAIAMHEEVVAYVVKWHTPTERIKRFCKKYWQVFLTIVAKLKQNQNK